MLRRGSYGIWPNLRNAAHGQKRSAIFTFDTSFRSGCFNVELFKLSDRPSHPHSFGITSICNPAKTMHISCHLNDSYESKVDVPRVIQILPPFGGHPLGRF
jgi:hypothetical protein